MKFQEKIFEFIKPAKTSRGVYTQKSHFKISITQDNKTGCGEIAPLPDLSVDGKVNYTPVLEECHNLSNSDLRDFSEAHIAMYPALNFAVESAFAQLSETPSPFKKGKEIIINGLVWMDTVDEMLEVAMKKASEGLRCLKFKVGALDHDSECRLIEKVRTAFPNITLRLDANGGFNFDDAQHKLKDFNAFQIHSLEQPIKVGNWEAMNEICAKSPIDIALDEELIGVYNQKYPLLKSIKPKYIILKPSLLGGFSPCDEWISEAQKLDIDWWATSALEGNIGLLAIAEWASSYDLSLPQGLGTGALYKENYPSSLALEKDILRYKVN